MAYDPTPAAPPNRDALERLILACHNILAHPVNSDTERDITLDVTLPGGTGAMEALTLALPPDFLLSLSIALNRAQWAAPPIVGFCGLQSISPERPDDLRDYLVSLAAAVSHLLSPAPAEPSRAGALAWAYGQLVGAMGVTAPTNRQGLYVTTYAFVTGPPEDWDLVKAALLDGEAAYQQAMADRQETSAEDEAHLGEQPLTAAEIIQLIEDGMVETRAQLAAAIARIAEAGPATHDGSTTEPDVTEQGKEPPAP